MIASASAVLRELPGTSRRKLGKKPCCLQRGFLFFFIGLSALDELFARFPASAVPGAFARR